MVIKNINAYYYHRNIERNIGGCCELHTRMASGSSSVRIDVSDDIGLTQCVHKQL